MWKTGKNEVVWKERHGLFQLSERSCCCWKLMTYLTGQATRIRNEKEMQRTANSWVPGLTGNAVSITDYKIEEEDKK